MLHVTLPHGPPNFIRTSPLANAEGWVDVDKETTRHVRYPNVFSIGDASSLPTSKTAAAVRKQAPALVKNLVAAMEGPPAAARYAGYTSCPIVPGYGKLMMCEFDYDKKPVETLPVDQRARAAPGHSHTRWRREPLGTGRHWLSALAEEPAAVRGCTRPGSARENKP